MNNEYVSTESKNNNNDDDSFNNEVNDYLQNIVNQLNTVTANDMYSFFDKMQSQDHSAKNTSF